MANRRRGVYDLLISPRFQIIGSLLQVKTTAEIVLRNRIDCEEVNEKMVARGNSAGTIVANIIIFLCERRAFDILRKRDCFIEGISTAECAGCRPNFNGLVMLILCEDFPFAIMVEIRGVYVRNCPHTEIDHYGCIKGQRIEVIALGDKGAHVGDGCTVYVDKIIAISNDADRVQFVIYDI